MLKLPSNPWLFVARVLLVVTITALTCELFYVEGYDSGKAKQLTEQQGLELQWKEQALADERAYTARLEAVQKEWAQSVSFTAAQSAALAQSNQSLQTQMFQLKKDIPNVIQTDANRSGCVRGLGIDSLRVYNRALGYAD